MLFLFDWSAPTTRFAPVLRPLTTAAVAVRVGCVLSLGRSFGIAAANRGVVTTGAYRYVRHPMYAAYVLSTVLQLCLHPSFRNSLVVACSCSFHAWRIRCEEQLLGQSSTYRAYCARVRWRMLPQQSSPAPVRSGLVTPMSRTAKRPGKAAEVRISAGWSSGTLGTRPTDSTEAVGSARCARASTSSRTP